MAQQHNMRFCLRAALLFPLCILLGHKVAHASVPPSPPCSTYNASAEGCSGYVGNYTGICSLNGTVNELRIDAFESVDSVISSSVTSARIANSCNLYATINITHQTNGRPTVSLIKIDGSLSIRSDILFVNIAGTEYRIDNRPNNLTDSTGKKISGLIIAMHQYTLILIKSKVTAPVQSPEIQTVPIQEEEDESSNTESAPPPAEEPVYDLAAVQEQPEFPGGMSKMYEYIQNHTVYPQMEQNAGIQGKVYVQFVVDKDGSVEDVRIFRGVSPGLDKEALRVVKPMPKWSPGKMNGKAVKTRFTIPVQFKSR